MKKITFLFLLLLTVSINFKIKAQPCTTITAPYSESFDLNSTPTCWSQAASLGGPWELGQLGSASFAASAFDDHSNNGGYFAWLDFNGTDDAVVLEMPSIDVSIVGTPLLSFWMASFNPANSDLNLLYLEAWNGTSWLMIDSFTQNNALWMQHNVNLSSFIYGADLVKIRFRAESGGGANDMFNDLLIDDVQITGSVGLNQKVNNVNIRISPNPSKGVFSLSANIPNLNEIAIKITNLQGQVVFYKNYRANNSFVHEQINLKECAKGIYVVTVISEKSVTTKKIVLQ